MNEVELNELLTDLGPAPPVAHAARTWPRRRRATHYLAARTVLSRLVDSGGVKVSDGELVSTIGDLFPLPGGLDAELRRRLDRFGPQCRMLLTRAAFLGDGALLPTSRRSPHSRQPSSTPVGRGGSGWRAARRRDALPVRAPPAPPAAVPRARRTPAPATPSGAGRPPRGELLGRSPKGDRDRRSPPTQRPRCDAGRAAVEAQPGCGRAGVRGPRHVAGRGRSLLRPRLGCCPARRSCVPVRSSSCRLGSGTSATTTSGLPNGACWRPWPTPRRPVTSRRGAPRRCWCDTVPN